MVNVLNTSAECFNLWSAVGAPALLFYFLTDFLSVWDPSWTWKVALRQYLLTRLLHWTGAYQSWRLHRNSYRIQEVQEGTLKKLLSLNADTLYSREHNLGRIQSSQDFVRTQPLSKFPQYAPYVERIKQGETNIMTSDKITYMASTSGTTGQPAIIPFTSVIRSQQLATISLFQYNTQKQIPIEQLHRLRPVSDSGDVQSVGRSDVTPGMKNLSEIILQKKKIFLRNECKKKSI
jgi:hypothetical protein